MKTENNYIETDLGNVAPNPRGEYSDAETYEYLDYVSYMDGSYLCIAETVTGIAPEDGKNTEYWQMNSTPGRLTPEYIVMHDRVANLSEQVEADTEEVRKSKENIESMEQNVTNLHERTLQATEDAERSKDTAAGYAESAEKSRLATETAEQNVNAQITRFDAHVTEQTESAKQDIESARIEANKAILNQQEASVQGVTKVGNAAISETGRAEQAAKESASEASTSEQNAKASETAVKKAEKNVSSLAEQVVTNAKQVSENKETVESARQEMTESITQIQQNTEDVAVLKDELDKSKKSIKSLEFGIDELRKRTSIDTYDELSEVIAKGKTEEYINVGDELMVNRITGLEITSNNSSLAFTITDEQLFVEKVGRIDDDTYTLIYKESKWHYLEEAIELSDIGIVVNGSPNENDLINIKMNYTQVSHTFVDFDSSGTNATRPKDTSIEHFAIVEETYIPNSFNFDAPESALCITPGYTLKAGKYYVYNVADATSDYWCNYKRLYYLFEIPTDITATEDTGDIQLRFVSRGNRETTGDARGVYELTCKPYKCADDALYNNDSVTFVGQVSAPSSEYKDIRTVEGFTVDQTMESVGIIYNNLGHVCYGNNEWAVSNLRQRLGSKEKSMKAVRLHKNDIVSAMKNARGFMWGLDPRFVEMIKPCVVYMKHGLNDEFTRYELYSCEDVATLLSMKEMSFDMQTDEGVVTKLYNAYTNGTLTNNDVASRAKADKAGESPKNYRWSRSASAHYSHDARPVAPTGASDGGGASYGSRFAAAYIIGEAEPSRIITSVEA